LSAARLPVLQDGHFYKSVGAGTSCVRHRKELGGGPSDVIRCVAFAFASRQREGRLALWLCESAGQLDEGFDEGIPFCDAHLPQLHLLAPRPLLRGILLHLTELGQVAFIP
ncbi:hypothetical protein GOODEAATRI_027273, partial [Goodea atripinnis]